MRPYDRSGGNPMVWSKVKWADEKRVPCFGRHVVNCYQYFNVGISTNTRMFCEHSLHWKFDHSAGSRTKKVDDALWRPSYPSAINHQPQNGLDDFTLQSNQPPNESSSHRGCYNSSSQTHWLIYVPGSLWWQEHHVFPIAPLNHWTIIYRLQLCEPNGIW